MRSAFSLVELLVVMAIILIMFVMYFNPNSESYQRRKLTACQKNLQNVYVALEIYARDHTERFPVMTNARSSEGPLSLLVPAYTARTDFFVCPAADEKEPPHGKSFTGGRISYAYYMGRAISDGGTNALVTDRQVNTGSKAAGAVVFSANGKPPGNNHRRFGGNVLFCDGNIEHQSATSSIALPFPSGVVLLNPR